MNTNAYKVLNTENENEPSCQVSLGTYVMMTVISLIVGVFIGMGIMSSIWANTAIEKGHGEYNSKTGVFQWVTNRVDK